MSDPKAYLLAVEAKLAKDPNNEQLLQLKNNLLEFIPISYSLEEDDKRDKELEKASRNQTVIDKSDNNRPESNDQTSTSSEQVQSDSNQDMIARKRELNRKKRAKLKEKIKHETQIAESEKQSWQSFANKKGLKGLAKKSIFASPHSVSGKVGVGTNGIADAPPATSTTLAFGKHNKH